jgi:predicted dehydrogenase
VIPRVGFLGVGWIGRNRMDALARSGLIDVVAVSDASAEAANDAAASVGAATVAPDALLDGAVDLDALVIATPSALHAEQAMTALARGWAVFCQKPLGRSADECRAIVDAARHADRLLGVDLSYRHLEAVDAMRKVIDAGEIGTVYAVDLVFHNAYGPDKPWFTDRTLAGGGCLIDLGIHLVDLGLWLLDWPEVAGATTRMFARGEPVSADADVVEDHVMARVDLADGRTMNVACSWFLHAGRDAVIEATFHGTDGSVALQNVDGSFYDFRAVRHHRTTSEVLALPPDDWSGRAAVAWAQRLASGIGFDQACEEHVRVAAALDEVYGR